MKMMQSKDRIIIFTTHHRDVINVATKILVLVEGKLQVFGNSSDVLAKITKPPQASK
jgi:ABC-type protease/lipase transport system fused ATPase/permease subunit